MINELWTMNHKYRNSIQSYKCIITCAYIYCDYNIQNLGQGTKHMCIKKVTEK